MPVFWAELNVAVVPMGCWQGCRQGLCCLHCLALGSTATRGQVLLGWPAGPTLQTKTLPSSCASLGYCGRPSLLPILPQHYVPLASYRSSLSALWCFLRGAQQQVRIHACVWNNRRGSTARVTFLFKVLRTKNVKRKRPVFQSVRTKSIPFKYFCSSKLFCIQKTYLLHIWTCGKKGRNALIPEITLQSFGDFTLLCSCSSQNSFIPGTEEFLGVSVSFPLAVCIQEWAYVAY